MCSRSSLRLGVVLAVFTAAVNLGFAQINIQSADETKFARPIQHGHMRQKTRIWTGLFPSMRTMLQLFHSMLP
jgi:hypothetical protein